jgi:hypothetical protein
VRVTWFGICVAAPLAVLAAACGGAPRAATQVNAPAALQRYTQLQSCLSHAGLIGAGKPKAGWPRLLGMGSPNALVQASIFLTPAGAHHAAARYASDEAAYLRRQRKARISGLSPLPRLNIVTVDRVFARYQAKGHLAAAITTCLRG